MFHEESLVTTVFKVLNVGVLVATGIYFFRKYRSSIYQQIEQEKIDERTLQQELNRAQIAHKEHEQYIHKEKQWLMYMQSRIEQWNQVIDAEFVKQQMQAEKRKQAMEHKLSLRADAIALDHAKKVTVPLIMSKAQHELERKYKGTEGKQYIARVIDYCKRMIHES